MVGKATGSQGTIQVGDDTISYSIQGTNLGFVWRYITIAKSEKQAKWEKQ
jgi:hypothetical protein